ncbi:MFS transporter [Streptomyces sp. M19]
MLMFVVNYIDRVNIGFAKDALETDSGIGAGAYGLGAGLFFVTYAVFEIPSNILLERYGAKFWLTRIMMSWGLVSALMMFAHNEVIFYVLRMALGAAEAGFFAGVIFYFTQWFPNDIRGRANAALYSASAVAAVIAGPLSGALLSMDDMLGLHGWQWMFLCEGLAAIAVGAVVWSRLESRPTDANWLSAGEGGADRPARRRGGGTGRGQTGRGSVPLVDAARPADAAVLFRLLRRPTRAVLRHLLAPGFRTRYRGLSEFMIGLISVTPFVFAFFAILVAGQLSDRTGMRRTVLAVGFLLAALGLAVAAVTSPVLAVIMLVVATVGFKVAASSFFVIPSSIWSARWWPRASR